MTEQQFMADVRKLFELQDQLKAVRESVKDRAASLRSELSATDAAVKSYMLENGLEICNYQQQRLQLALTERPMPLTRAAIMAGLLKHMTEAEAERCMLSMQEAAGTKRVATLRRARRAAARAPRAPRAGARGGARGGRAAQQGTEATQPPATVADLVTADLAPPPIEYDSD